MKKVILLTLLLVVIFVTSAVVHLPAQLVVKYAPLPGALQLSGVEGTLWNGRAQSVSWQRDNFGQVQWQFQPSKLFSGKAEAQIRFGRGSDMQLTGRGVVGYRLSGAYAENLIASLPVEQVLAFAPRLPIPLELTGQVELSVKHLTYAAPYCQTAEGSVVWNTDTIGTPVEDLQVGPIVANFTCSDSTITIKGDQRSSQVESAAEVVVQPNQNYQSTAWFKPGEEFPAAFREQLSWLPTPDGQGRYRFNYNGRLRF
ncbi:type II secretion system protein N [Vibrio sp. MarTm2]|uniref:type II secretion system protein N n=1 Tax=Vibrio sp. MarTm2 TaxID=2998831 RepID=UPI0022CD9BAA|nr:type II secretion system protein N [Vibrio sp. MarTm2]MDA0130338.1 type II secretion system protein N [Vibrio sp. MarTm2]